VTDLRYSLREALSFDTVVVFITKLLMVDHT
jgi:hypothetical protein